MDHFYFIEFSNEHFVHFIACELHNALNVLRVGAYIQYITLIKKQQNRLSVRESVLILCNCQNHLNNFTLIGWLVIEDENIVRGLASVRLCAGCHGFYCQFIDITLILCDSMCQNAVIKMAGD